MKAKPKNTVSIGGIAAAFVFIQPLGMFLLGLRLLHNKQEILKNGRTMFKVAVVFLALFLIFLLVDYQSITDFYYSFYLFGGGAVIGLIMSLIMIRQGLKDEKYKAAVEIHKLTKLHSIADTVKTPVETAIRDLRYMIEHDIFPNAELNVEEQIFTLNVRLRGEEKMRTMRCSGCGATVFAVSSKGTVCEYCGSPVNYDMPN